MKKIYWVLPLFLAACKNEKPEQQSTIFGGGDDAEIVESVDHDGNKMEAAETWTAENVGEKFIDLTLPRLEGGEASLSSFVSNNKVTVIDCWASWCGPCMAEMPNIAMLYRKYHSLGVEVVGVSFDEDQRDWNNTVRIHDMIWPQLGELKGWDNQFAQAFGVNAIPHTIVINQKGEIVARGLRGEKLIDAVAKALSGK